MSRKKRKMKALRAKEEQACEQSPTKWLTQGLIFSGALNIALLTSLIFFVVKGKDDSDYSSKSASNYQIAADASLQEAIDEYLNLNYQDLRSQLDLKSHIEDGVTQRDLALAILCHKFNFDIDRALLGQSLNQRYFTSHQLDHACDLAVYTGLNEDHYRLIYSFIQTEQWPFTSKGVFTLLQNEPTDTTLKNAFYLTKEFMTLEALFCKYGVSKEKLLEMTLSASFEVLDEFCKSQFNLQDFSDPLRIDFLSLYLDYGSSASAELILQVDPNFALKKLSDQKLVAILGLLENRSELSENFALHIALGSRSEWVKSEACRLLYHYCNKPFEEPLNHQKAMHFLTHEYHLNVQAPLVKEESITTYVEAPYQDTSSKIYTVQKGDCLSKIARKHQVDVKNIKALNHLEKDMIKEGMTLLIP